MLSENVLKIILGLYSHKISCTYTVFLHSESQNEISLKTHKKLNNKNFLLMK